MFMPVGFQQPQMVSNGLTFYIDFSDKTSYPGYGTTVRDLSGQKRANSTLNVGTPANCFLNEYGGGVAIEGTFSAPSTTKVSNTWLGDYLYFESTASNWTFQECYTSYWTGSTDPYWKSFGDSGWFKLEWYNRILAFSNTPGLAFAYYSGYSGMTPAPNLQRKPNVITFVNNNATMSMYVNGVKNEVNVPLSGSIVAYALGYAQGTGVANTGSFYSFAYYNRALSSAEVLQNFTYQRSRFNL